MNMVNFYLIHNHIEQAYELLNQVEHMLKGSNYFYELNQLFYLKGIYFIKKGSIEKGVKLCQESIDTLVYFKKFDNANHKQEELNSLINEVSNS